MSVCLYRPRHVFAYTTNCLGQFLVLSNIFIFFYFYFLHILANWICTKNPNGAEIYSIRFVPTAGRPLFLLSILTSRRYFYAVVCLANVRYLYSGITGPVARFVVARVAGRNSFLSEQRRPFYWAAWGLYVRHRGTRIPPSIQHARFFIVGMVTRCEVNRMTMTSITSE